MKGLKFIAPALCALMVTGCGLTDAAKGGMIGGAAGGAAGAGLGAGIGALINGKKGAKIGAAIGAGTGVAAGATTGALIGKKMDKAKAAAAAVKNAQVVDYTDINGLPAVKITFESGILFASGKNALQDAAKSSLSQFAADVLKANPDMDVAIIGHTDNDSWKNSTAEQSKKKNFDLSVNRAKAVSDYLLAQGVAASQLKTISGMGEDDPVADNATAEGKAQNRRVEVYLYASEAMIKAAEAEAK